MHSCGQNYSSLALTVFAVEGGTDGRTDGQTDGRTDAQTAGNPISPFGLCEPVGDKNWLNQKINKPLAQQIPHVHFWGHDKHLIDSIQLCMARKVIC